MYHHKEPTAADVLLAESRHRMFNCLQMLSALVRMRLRDCPSLETRAELVWVLESVSVLTRLQRTLDGPERADLQAHLVEAVDLWRRVGRDQGIEVRLDLDRDVAVEAHLVTPVALIVQELVTNCFEHAFPDGRAGSVLIALRCASGATASITVQDDGAGYDPRDEDPRDPPSHGLRIVRGLAEGAGVSFTFDHGHQGGTVARLRFARRA